MQSRKRDTDVQNRLLDSGRRQGWDVLKEQHVYYLGWNRSPAQVGCMIQVLGPGALGRPRGIGWRERWEAGSGWGIHVTPWLIYVNVWPNPLQCCEVINLQLIKINEKKKKNPIHSYTLLKVKVLVFQCLTLCNPMDCSPPGSSVQGILQARIPVVAVSDLVQSIRCANSLWPHGLQHARLPCPSLSPIVCSISCPLYW